jgi:CHAD domain-containing protein
MTTERTTIRRRLEIGRGTHRPPWGGRKAGHRSIVAPMMATVAASMAVGVGITVVKLTRDRRSKQRDRRLGLLSGEPLGEGLQRMALGQLDLALEALGDGEKAPSKKDVHETRKALKRLRTLLRLLRGRLGEDIYAREDRALRDAARRLAGARDAEVMLATLDSLIERHSRKLKGRPGVMALRGALLSERDNARRQTLSDPRATAQVVAELRACRVRVAKWQLPKLSDLELVESGLLHLYRQGRKRRRTAAAAKRDDARKMHQWRKRVKDLRYAAEMLQPANGPMRGAVRRMHRLARRADHLGELLGEDHDLAVLAERILQDGTSAGGGGQTSAAKLIKGPTRKTLLKLIAKRRHKLRRRALREGEQLYGTGPRTFMRHARAARG